MMKKFEREQEKWNFLGKKEVVKTKQPNMRAVVGWQSWLIMMMCQENKQKMDEMSHEV